jgi:hypothetical protein
MPTLAYTIEVINIEPEPFVQIETTRVVWDKDVVNISADQAVAFASERGRPRRRRKRHRARS